MDAKIVFRYHRAPNPLDCGRVMVFDSDPKAAWLDDYMRTETVINLQVQTRAQTVTG
jgi:hypothetical protein